ncbi:uncharacterized protein LAJ45_01277 [Morchella importuna]|uniref:uncharacterized protein n=1 Tax=Morchella importuna TaxID=1174673 RepID=UPI001E8CAD1A|nr:uncharacterized protein LAJ45_01277 [Morchella importuna]KAH8154746.1 hypothetical protein LAJ45_01277 [Morchella importuna]
MARSMAQIQDKRANVDGKRTAFVLCGVPISENKVKRARENHDYGVDLGLTYIRDVVPSQIGYFTPEPQDELYEAIKYKGLNEDGYMMVNGMEGAARGTDSQDSYDGDSQDSIEISDDWTNITREELEPRRANPETDSIEPIYEGDRELKDNMPSLVGWPVENLELSTELIGMHGSSFIGMITSTHHDLHSDLAYTGILEAEGDRNIIKSTELRGCVWMSSGWNGRGFMGNLFDDEYE